MTKETGGPAFPGLHPSKECHYNDAGMTLRDYAAIKFAAAWVTVLGSEGLRETRDQRAAECNRLGMVQADDFMESRK